MANTLNLFRNGAVGFIDWLGLPAEFIQSSGSRKQMKALLHLLLDDAANLFSHILGLILQRIMKTIVAVCESDRHHVGDPLL